MIARLVSVIGGNPSIVTAETPLGTLRGEWHSDGDAIEGDTYQIELTVRGPLEWGKDIQVAATDQRAPSLSIEDGSVVITGIIDEIDPDEIATVSLGHGFLRVATVGDGPTLWQGASVTITTANLEIYDAGY